MVGDRVVRGRAAAGLTGDVWARISPDSGEVRAQTCQGTAIADQVVEIYSPCGPAREDYFRRALEINRSVLHGSIAIERCQDQDYFVMGNAYPRTSCDAVEIRQSVLMIARHVDSIELALTGVDLH